MRKTTTAPRKTASSAKDISRFLPGLIIFLLLFGIVMIYNATSVYSQSTFGGGYRFALQQIVWAILGLTGFYIFYRLDYQFLKKIYFPIVVITLLILSTLALVGLLPCESSIPFAPCVNGANRWFYLNPSPLPRIPLLGVLGFQPSELAKLAVIIYLSVQLSKLDLKDNSSFWVYIIASGIFSSLIILQPNMSTAVLVFLIATSIYFASGASIKPLFITFPLLLLSAGILMFLSPYRRERLLTFLGNNSGTHETTSYHIQQILIALGSGGFLGVGFGQSRQKFQYLPEVAADSIFAIIGEELGFLGTTFVILAFALLIYKGFNVAKESKDMLGKLLATGITSWIGLQFFINVAAMTQIIPLTGVPIPLISYGGSSLVFTLIGLGILSNIDYQNQT